VGEGVQGFAPGDRVIGMIDPSANGAYAEKVAAPAASFVKIPDWLDLVDAAALPTGAMTGIQLAELGAKAKPGDRILVTGAAGSVGRAAAYVAAAAGAQVVAGLRSHMFAALDGLPLAGMVDLHDAQAVEAAGPFNAIADTVGGRAAEKLCRFVKPNGILASVVLPPPLPPIGSSIALAPIWVTFDGPRLLRFIDDLHAKGWTMPIVHRLPLFDADRAHTLMEAGSVGGKILLVP
jgi:NADPH:quinone reductase-like Zn-dependent oxidoreductase